MISITSFHPHFKDEQTEAYRIELRFLGATASMWQRWYMHMCFSNTKLVTEWYIYTLWPQRAALAHPPMGGFKSLWNHGQGWTASQVPSALGPRRHQQFRLGLHGFEGDLCLMWSQSLSPGNFHLPLSKKIITSAANEVSCQSPYQ